MTEEDLPPEEGWTGRKPLSKDWQMVLKQNRDDRLSSLKSSVQDDPFTIAFTLKKDELKNVCEDLNVSVSSNKAEQTALRTQGY